MTTMSPTLTTVPAGTLPALSDQVVLKSKRRVLPLGIDLAITIDGTGSSQAFAAGIPATVRLIGDEISKKVANMRVYLQKHGDLDYGEAPVMLTGRGMLDQAYAEVDCIRFGGGGDAEEHHLDGVETLFEAVPWQGRQLQSRGCIILFATADTKPLRSGASARELGERIRNAGVMLYAVCEPSAQLNEMVQA
ncbi:MAG TPA: hypothetical protein VGH49_10510, partial [Xanthobacteraceae bacterium]